MNVWWLSLHDHIPARGMWDQTIVEHLLARLPATDVSHTLTAPDGGDAVVVVPGAANAAEDVSDAVSHLDRVVLIVTGDEGSHFAADRFQHPDYTVWIQNPRTDRHQDVRPLPVGWTPHVDQRYASRPPPNKVLDWTFAGQVTHRRRQSAVAVMRRMSGGRLVTSEAFTEGVSRDEYADMLYDAKVAPCPAGIVTPDTFRAWEALRAGCVPVVDRQAGEWDVPRDYWFQHDVPFPVVDDWSRLPDIVDKVREAWPVDAVETGGWWSQRLHTLRRTLADDCRLDRPKLAVYIPTSPVPSHPSTDVIEQTVASIRDRLGDVPIHIAADGVRTEQSHLSGRYLRYLQRILYLSQHRWGDVTVHVHWDHLHQSGMLHTVLPQIDAEALLYVEHDTPLVGDIPLDALADVVCSDRADVVRLHHETHVLDAHRHLYPTDTPEDVDGLPLLPTGQWSQRPHLASTDLYRHLAETYFGRRARTMVEDVMHGVVATDYAENGWGRWKLYLYAPDGNMQRSTHLDARGSEPKFDMEFAYDGDTPQFAPAPTEGRDDGR